MLLLALACLATGPSGDDDDDSAVDDTGGGGTEDYLDQVDPDSLPAGGNPCRVPEIVTIDYVVDGDTAWVQGSRGDENVRFIGVDTPEVGWEGEASDCYGDEAQAFTREHLEGRRAWLTFDAVCTDYFDRTLAYVLTGGDEQDFFERVLLRSGYAQAYPFDETDTFETLFDEDEAFARDNQLGGWAACGW